MSLNGNMRQVLRLRARSARAIIAALVILNALAGSLHSVLAAPEGQGEAADLCTAGLDAFYAGDDNSALPLLEDGFARLDPDTADAHFGDCAVVLCALRRVQGNVDGAIQACQAALEIYVAADDLFSQSIALNTLGDTYVAAGDTVSALGAYERAIDVAQAAGNGEGVVIALNNVGVIYRAQGRLAEALEKLSQALQIATEIDDTIGQQETLTNMGRVYKAQARYDEAVDAYTDALTLARANGDRRGEAGILGYLGEARQAQGRYEDARQHYDAALDLAREAGSAATEVTILGLLGNLYWARGYYTEALATYEQGLQLARALNDLGREGHLLNAIGLVYVGLGRYEDATMSYEAALAIAQAQQDLDEEAAALHNLGQVYESQGRFAEALRLFQQSLTIVQTIGFRAEESIVLNSIAGIFTSQGRHTEALDVYAEALQIAEEIGDLSQEGNVHNNIGYAYYQLARYEDAITHYLTALETARQLGDLAEEAKRMNNLAVVHDELGEYEQALILYEQVLAINRQLRDLDGEISTLNNIGASYFSQGQTEEAMPYLEEAIPLARTLGDPVMLARLLANMGESLLDLERQSEALPYFSEAMDIVEDVRAVAGSEAGRTSFADRFIDIYASATSLFHQLDRDEEAFVTSERGRSRAFLDTLATGQVELNDETAAGLLARQRELYAQRLAAQDALARLASQDPIDATALAQAQDQLAALEAEYAALLDSIALQGDQLLQLATGRNSVLTLPAVQALIDTETTLVSYYMLGDAGTLAFVITQSAFTAVELPDATTARVSRALEDLSLWLDLESAHPPELVDLYTWLVEPLLPHLRTTYVGVIPHQALHYAPLAALSNGATYFGDQFTLFLLPSASALPYIQANREQTPIDDGQSGATPDREIQPALVYGNPATDAQLSVLVNAEAEARAVSNLLGAPVYTSRDASETRLWREAERSRIVHLAAHGAYNRTSPLYSALYLAPDSQEDGRLEVHEVYGLDLSQSDLVVLSACETNLGQLSAGDEVIGLTRAFFFAGTPTVIASLWSVDDLATKELMLAFYQGLDNGLSKGAALAAAQAQIRAAYPSPYYWAAFVLNGDPHAMGNSSTSTITATTTTADEAAKTSTVPSELPEEPDQTTPSTRGATSTTTSSTAPPTGPALPQKRPTSAPAWLYKVIGQLQ